MTRAFPQDPDDADDRSSLPRSHAGGGGGAGAGGGGTGMRIIVPLQGVVQGRGGLVLGSLIPCALFYFFQLYLKRNRPSPSPPSPSTSSSNLSELSTIPRSLSRGLLSPRGSAGRAQLSSRGAAIARPDDSHYYIGYNRCLENPYHPSSNPDGIVQLGLAENQVVSWVMSIGSLRV